MRKKGRREGKIKRWRDMECVSRMWRKRRRRIMGEREERKREGTKNKK